MQDAILIAKVPIGSVNKKELIDNTSDIKVIWVCNVAKVWLVSRSYG